MKSKIFLMVSFAVLVLLAACSPAVPEPTFPIGKFVSTSNANNEYRFRDDGTWSYYIGGLMSAKGKYQIENNLFTFPNEGTGECPYAATYEWTFDGKTLTFKLQGEDACDPRREATDGQSFTME